MPGRLTTPEAAALMNCNEAGVNSAVKRGLLKPLGNPAQNARKYFSTKAVLALLDDEKKLARLTQAIYDDTREHNRAGEAA